MEPTGTREYRGGASLATDLATGSRASPVNRATSRCERPPPTPTASPPHLSPLLRTQDTLVLTRSQADRAWVRIQPDNTARRAPWPTSQLTQLPWYSLGADMSPVAGNGCPSSRPKPG